MRLTSDSWSSVTHRRGTLNLSLNTFFYDILQKPLLFVGNDGNLFYFFCFLFSTPWALIESLNAGC